MPTMEATQRVKLAYPDKSFHYCGNDARERIVEYIESFINEHGYSPSYDDVAEGCGYTTTSAIHYHLNILKNAGVITFEPNTARSIRLTG